MSRPRRPFIDPRIRERLVGLRRQEGRRRLRILLVTSGAMAAIVGVVAFLHSPLLRVERVRVVGARRTSRAAILRVTHLDRHPLMVEVNGGTVAREAETLPWVARVRARKDWPGTVRLTVTERVPVAVAPAAKGSALLDAGGRVLELVDAAPAGLPRLVGVPPVGPAGSVVPDGDRALLAVAGAMAPALIARAPEVALADGGVIELHLVPSGVVRFGPPTQVEEKLQAVATILARADLKGARVIDVRVPSAPVLTRG